MGKKCFVRNCDSVYGTCAERVSLFKAPHEPERLEKWRRAIPRADRVLQPTDHVCAKHFPDEVISTAYHTEYKGNVLLHAPKKPVLSPEAVPSIFPNCPKYLTVPQKSRKPPRKRQALVPTSRNQGQPVVPSTSEELRQNGENAPGLQTSSEDADTESTGALRKRPRLDFNSFEPSAHEEGAFQRETNTRTSDAVSQQAKKEFFFIQELFFCLLHPSSLAARNRQIF
ncbi:hypothetical protein HPB50_022120 [Hyalomma asiaticum]|uniref:Uncharacterized protein n=1 Tax=Hyalomma asiaticum TaxID=266040 RepID=A0ACB7SNL1_HYAAI|nr:hypothetical protein HPB50_022120 [Hyalomma asiaticum]